MFARRIVAPRLQNVTVMKIDKRLVGASLAILLSGSGVASAHPSSTSSSVRARAAEATEQTTKQTTERSVAMAKPTHSDVSDAYAAREAAAPQSAKFKGGGTSLYIGGSTVVIVLLVVLLVVLL